MDFLWQSPNMIYRGLLYGRGGGNFVGFAIMWVWLVGLCNVNVVFVVVGVLEFSGGN